MARGNMRLGISELVDVLEEVEALLIRVANADGEVDALERKALDTCRVAVAGGQSLEGRELIATSLKRGLLEPPGRVHDLINDYTRTYSLPA